MDDERWIPTAERRPEKGQRVDWIAPSGETVIGGTFHNVWLLPDGTMYVYYTPPSWRPAKGD